MATAMTATTRPGEVSKSKRIAGLMQNVLVNKYPLCTEMSRLVTESVKKTDGEPSVMRTARAQAKFLEERTIFIEDGELIIGNAASKPMGFEANFFSYWFLMGVWNKNGIAELRKEFLDIPAETEKELLELSDFWKTALPRQDLYDMHDEEKLWAFRQSGMLIPPLKSKEEAVLNGGFAEGTLGIGLGPDYMSIDYGAVMGKGLASFVQDAEKELGTINYFDPGAVKKVHFLKAAIIVHKAVIRFANRFADLAEQMAAKESDPVRKQELEQIAETCRWVPANRPRTFREAIQFFWFMYLLFASMTTPLGRFDQYMYPYYKADKAAGRITDEQVLELLQCLRLKNMQVLETSGSGHRGKWSGLAKWNNMVIGGQTVDGRDATNELSYLVLEAAKCCPTPHHTITVRVHEGTPEALLLKSIEVLKTGIGMPAFISDKSYIENLLSKDVPLKLARDYYVMGCLDANVPEGCGELYELLVMPLMFDIFLHNGVEPRTGRQLGPRTGELESFGSFDELVRTLKEHLAYFMRVHAEENSLFWQVNRELFPDAFTASLFKDGIKQGQVRVDRKLPYKLGPTMCAAGMINIADSLAAIKKLVYDEKKVTMAELKAALNANWAGERNQEIRKMCLAAPKFGNDDDYVDLIARDLYDFFVETAATIDHHRGGKYNAAAISITTHEPGGKLTGATPDGRCAGETLADGTLSPMRGQDRRGPTAVFKSAAKVDQTAFQSTLLNMKFHPTALKSTEDMRKLSSLIRTYFGMGGKQVQFNVIGKETLIEAQQHPENYRDLVVRVAGYSAYFVQLTRAVQDEIIARTENETAC